MNEVARDLIGVELLVDGVGGEIVEVEAYSPDEPGSHSFRGRTPRNAVMFGPPGYAYVYRSYGIHWCLNFVCGPGELASADPDPRARADDRPRRDAQARRGLDDERLLCSGPGRLCEALGVTGAFDGLPLDAPPFSLRPPQREARGRRRAAYRPDEGRRAAVALRTGGVAVRQPALPDGVALRACAPEVQLAFVVGAFPLKNSIVVAPEQPPSSSSSLPLR